MFLKTEEQMPVYRTEAENDLSVVTAAYKMVGGVEKSAFHKPGLADFPGTQVSVSDIFNIFQGYFSEKTAFCIHLMYSSFYDISGLPFLLLSECMIFSIIQESGRFYQCKNSRFTFKT